MKYVTLIFAALGVVILTAGAYVCYFYAKLGYGVSSGTETWGQFGDYFGGILNPLLSFIALLCLIQSLNLQNQANRDLQAEVINTRQHEKFRSFNLLFFNVIESQKSQVGNITIRSSANDGSPQISGIDAILQLEEQIETMRDNGALDEDIGHYLDAVDCKDCIFGTLRAFYLAAKLVTDRLSGAEGFLLIDRTSHFQTLINFTDFSQLRLILMAAQFIKCPYSAFLTTHNELKDVLNEVGLKFDLY